jgi:hypothetical protein
VTAGKRGLGFMIWGALLLLCAGIGYAQAPPSISTPEVIMTDESSAWVVFQTDRPAKATVEYASTDGAPRTVSETEFVTEHAVLLTGLIQGLTYAGTISVVTEDGATASAVIPPFRATEPRVDVALEVPPQVFFTGPDEAVIALSTNTVSTVEVRYGRNGQLTEVVRQDDPAKTHALTLPRLIPGEFYTYTVTVRGFDGSIVTTAPATFKVQPFERNLTISKPEIFQTGENSAFVVFNTTKPARATVEFRSTNGAPRTVTEADFDTDHAVLIDGLIEGLTYEVRVTARSEDGDTAVEFADPFRATDVRREVGFEILPQVLFTGPDEAIVVFTTNIPSIGEVSYSRDGGPGMVVRENDPTETHAIPLTNLIPGATYTFLVSARGPEGNVVTTAPATFRVEPFERELTISTPEIFQTGENSAFIVFTTSKPARASVEFTSSSGVTRVVSETDFDAEHAVLLPNLITGETYTGRITVTSEDGDVAVAFFGPFMATDVAREIGFLVPPQVLITGPDEAIVTFTTNGPSTARVDYGLNGQLTQTARDDTPSELHAIPLTGLQPNATYTFAVTVRGADGSVNTTAPATFTVTPPEGGFTVGDVNLDGFVDVRDVVTILRYAVGILPLTLEQIDAADVDRNGGVDVRDAVRLLQIIMGLA